jgi:thymidine kinase
MFKSLQSLFGGKIMSKLWFRHGVVSASKSLQLLAVAHNYEVLQKKKIVCIKPKLDTRNKNIHTRAGLHRIADITLDPSDNDVFLYVARENPKPVCVLVDEVQFLTSTQIDGLADIVDNLGIPVICYGLKSDFKGEVSFEGSKRLLEIADKIEEIKTVCFYCEKKALFNLRLQHGNPIFEGESVLVGDISSDENGIEYRPVCRKCFKNAQGNRVSSEDWTAPSDEMSEVLYGESRHFN